MTARIYMLMLPLHAFENFLLLPTNSEVVIMSLLRLGALLSERTGIIEGTRYILA